MRQLQGKELVPTTKLTPRSYCQFLVCCRLARGHPPWMKTGCAVHRHCGEPSDAAIPRPQSPTDCFLAALFNDRLSVLRAFFFLVLQCSSSLVSRTQALSHPIRKMLLMRAVQEDAVPGPAHNWAARSSNSLGTPSVERLMIIIAARRPLQESKNPV
jgi:hypothetical protein